MMELHFHVGRYDEACPLVEKFHYSRRVPSNVQTVGTWHEDGGLFGDSGRAVAACFFSFPATRWSEPVWELSRLVRAPDVSCQLSGLISATARTVRKSKSIDILVSFADATQGHHGGIYQACSWRYDGQRSRAMDGILLNGVFVPGRACNHKWGTRSPNKLKERFPERDIHPHFDEGKHLYWLPLSRKGEQKAVRMGLSSRPYPKPRLLVAA
jgi:hypothetical protein